MNKVINTIFVLFLLAWMACSPKTTDSTPTPPTAPTTPTTPEPDNTLSDCQNWNSLPNKDDIIEKHVLYKDRMREVRAEQRKGTEANMEAMKRSLNEGFALWQRAYNAAPAADGRRADHFEDGITLYNLKYSMQTDSAEMKKTVESIMDLYDKRAECYGEVGYIYGRKGFDYFYKYSPFATDMEKYELLKKSIDIDQDTAQYFILNPMTALLSNLVIEEKIPQAEGQKYQAMIRRALQNGLDNCEGTKACEPWKIVEEYVPARLEQLEGIKGFYECDYYKEKYLPVFSADPTNCEVVDEVFSRLSYGGCSIEDPDFGDLINAKKTTCREVAPTSGILSQAAQALDEGRYKEAIGFYQEYIDNNADDNEKKARYTLRIAKIYYVHLKSFSQARNYARKALNYQPNWGDPYMLIGRLYASSGPLCGPGRGWDSQVVVWPAIDMWQKAKSVDPSVAAEANKFINRYTQYMPSVEDVFQRSLKEGDSYRVGCWIQETTRIRPAR